MNLIKRLQRRRLMVIALTVACIAPGGVALWYASRLPAEAAEDKQSFQSRLLKGVGSEVRFASAAAKPEQINAAVGSTADFIHWRSGFKISDKTRQKIVEAEAKVLRGEAPHITIEDLTERFTSAVSKRLATLTDEEIRWAAEMSVGEDGAIWPRADGKWGVLTKKELIREAKTGREWSQRGDYALKAALRTMIEEEVNNRVKSLEAALPEQFGEASVRGITPMQVLLIAYSVATDDPMTDSRSDIDQMLIQKRMLSGQTRAQRKEQKNGSGRPYGPQGKLQAFAAHIFFKKTAVYELLNLSEGGKK